MEKQLLTHCPIWFVKDIPSTVSYYETTLGFQKDFEYGTPAFYESVSRDGLQIHFRHDPQAQPAEKRSADIIDLFLLVTDVDRIYSEMVGRGANVVYGPALQEYGLKEFYVEDCNGYRLGFGQEISVDRTHGEFFENRIMSGSKFTNVSLEYAAFEDINLSSATFENVNLSSAVFRNINLNGTVISDSSIAGLTIRGYDIEALILAEEARRNAE
ncbi:MAG: VOC family protein [Janthinobacterium lividum]